MLTARRWRSKQKNKRKKYILKRSPKTHLFKNALQSTDFWKRRLSGFLVRLDRRKRKFSNTMMSYITKGHLTTVRHYIIALRMLNKACYRISIVLAIWCGRAKTIRIRHVWMRLFIYLFFWKKEKKISVFKYIWIHVAGA